MLCADLLHPAAFLTPRRITHSAWHRHIPFAFLLTALMRPRLIAELGTYRGDSYCSFCQIVDDLKLETLCYAIDTWRGDEHSGSYGEEVLNELSAYHDPLYGRFSQLVRSTFDEALLHFADGSIDLLHIDGLHTYTAVKHDFESWLPKMSDRSIVLFHDTNVRERGFGVWRLWAELRERYPAREFHFGHGLGVIATGAQLQSGVRALFNCSDDAWYELANILFSLGDRVALLGAESHAASLAAALGACETRAQMLADDVATLRAARELDLQNHAAEINKLSARGAFLTEETKRLAQSLENANTNILALYNSRSWLYTAPLRAISTKLFRVRHARILLRLAGRLRAVMPQATYRATMGPGACDPDAFLDTGCLLVCPPHALGLASLFAVELSKLGFVVEIADNLAQQARFHHLFVFCPNAFEEIPEGFIAIQLEQSTSDRWFNESYIAKLRKASAIIDYSIDNIEFLRGIGIELGKIYYVPVGAESHNGGASPDSTSSEVTRDIDVLFYGDDQCERRQILLSKLRDEFSVKVVNNLFGPPMWDLIRRSRVVANIHYYDDALLEMPRITECLALGTPVVSEASKDAASHTDIADSVDLVPTGDVHAMIAAIRRLLSDDEYFKVRVCAARSFSLRRNELFVQYFRRFLLAQGMVGYPSVQEIAERHVPEIRHGTGLCLSLSETPDRSRGFKRQHRPEFAVVEGLRHRLGWVGCGLSYKLIFQQALARGYSSLLICEDDVTFPIDYEQRKAVVDAYLEVHQDQWDLFSGFIADVSEQTRILRTETFDGVTFVWMDRAVSMVYNIYSRKVMHLLADWNPDNRDVDSNTIDRYMQGRTLRIVVAYPFLVTHDEGQSSAVWGFHNTQYRDFIDRSERVMKRLIEEHAANCRDDNHLLQ